ncbi:uncharacterized protein ELE39_001012 [Cryptosporidium sp. chipmunk genotype I]|uniref:uncharacterized protein n=1 Tax=Cryptosporidium sp. chipmunk genotype I TaxID=1280935 RepID=UPI00351A4A8C|nr:hypothetical protein ELE39_001012 [Cryptosporidium sp. chipmunk genotype I]
MINFKYLLLINFFVIAIHSNGFNSSPRNENIQSIEFSFLNAQAQEPFEGRRRTDFHTKITTVLFSGKDGNVSTEEFLAKYGFYGGKEDLKPICTKAELESILKELKKLLPGYYSLLGKNNYFRKLSFVATQGTVESNDVSNYIVNTRPLLHRAEANLITILERLFKCILTRKAKKYLKSYSGYSAEIAQVIYSKSLSSFSRKLINLLKYILSELESIYPKCLKKATGADLVECKAEGEALSICKIHLTSQKAVKNGEYQQPEAIKGILKSPGATRSRFNSDLVQKKVRFDEAAKSV